MQDYRLPKQCLFGWLPKTRPSRGPRRRWRDLVKKDLTAVKVGEDWYNVAQDRNKWSATWSQSLKEHQKEQQASGPIGEKTVLCCECGRWFRREQTRHDRSVLLREGGQYVNRAVPCSARAVRGGFGAEVAWQCIGAGERS